MAFGETITRLQRSVTPIDPWVMAVQAHGYPFPRCRRLKAIEAWINENKAALGLRAEISAGYCNTDRKAGRLRIPGKGREGTRLKIFSTDPGTVAFLGGARPLHDHNSAETYRHNFDVERWLADWIAKLPAATRRKLTVPQHWLSLPA